MTETPLPAGQSEDTLLGGRVRLRQPVAGYRAAIDPVFLAAAVPAVPGDRALDVGCGAGAAALCLAIRVPDCRARSSRKAPIRSPRRNSIVSC